MRTEHWSSQRFLHREDGMGFTLTDTTLEAGLDSIIHYKNHLEACYCIEGEGTIEDLSTGTVHEIKPGTMYALDRHDRHRLRARTQLRLVCVFNPALAGREIHDAEGSYPPGSA
jgi:L-ectoine synthase